MSTLFSKTAQSIALVIGVATTTLGDGFINAAQACTSQSTLSDTEQKLAAIGHVFTLQPDGSAYNGFGLLAARVRKELITLGIPEAEIVKGDPKVGEITITPEGISSLPPVIADNTDQASVYASGLSKTFNGLKTEIKPYYTADQSQPVNYTLEVSTGTDYDAGWRADTLSALLAEMRREMGIRKDDLTINYSVEQATFGVEVRDVTKYDQEFGAGAFMEKLNDTLIKENYYTGNLFAQDILKQTETVTKKAKPYRLNCD
jgi:hypothetical protein